MSDPHGAAHIFLNAAKLMDAYAAVMQPVCQRAQLPPVAVDIVLFLANNPGYDTARDICRYRGLKPGLVSFHVEKLVQDGYLTRQDDTADRRRTHLQCTPKADPLIAMGRARQHQFAAATMQGLSEETRRQLRAAMAIITQNLEAIRKNGLPAQAEPRSEEHP